MLEAGRAHALPCDLQRPSLLFCTLCCSAPLDFFSFTAGKKGIEVFSPFLQPLYHPRTHLFLYDYVVRAENELNDRVEGRICEKRVTSFSL